MERAQRVLEHLMNKIGGERGGEGSIGKGQRIGERRKLRGETISPLLLLVLMWWWWLLLLLLLWLLLELCGFLRIHNRKGRRGRDSNRRGGRRNRRGSSRAEWLRLRLREASKSFSSQSIRKLRNRTSIPGVRGADNLTHLGRAFVLRESSIFFHTKSKSSFEVQIFGFGLEHLSFVVNRGGGRLRAKVLEVLQRSGHASRGRRRLVFQVGNRGRQMDVTNMGVVLLQNSQQKGLLLLLSLFNTIEGFVDNVGMGPLLTLLAIDPTNLVRLRNNLDSCGSASQNVGRVSAAHRDVQAKQHVLVLAGQNLHANFEGGLIRAFVREMNFVTTGLGVHQFDFLSFTRVVTIVMNIDADGGLAEVDAVRVLGVVGDSKNDVKGSVLHNNMDITRNTSLSSQKKLSKAILLIHHKLRSIHHNRKSQNARQNNGSPTSTEKPKKNPRTGVQTNFFPP